MTELRSFCIETNNLKCSILRFVEFLLRQADVADARVEPNHRTLIFVEGPTTRRIGNLLAAKFKPGAGSALITRKRGQRVNVLRFNPRANKRWKRLM